MHCTYMALQHRHTGEAWATLNKILCVDVSRLGAGEMTVAKARAELERTREAWQFRSPDFATGEFRVVRGVCAANGSFIADEIVPVTPAGVAQRISETRARPPMLRLTPATVGDVLRVIDAPDLPERCTSTIEMFPGVAQ